MKHHEYEFKAKDKRCTGRVVIQYRKTGEFFNIQSTLKWKGKYFNKDDASAKHLLSVLPLHLDGIENHPNFTIKKLADADAPVDTETSKKISNWNKFYKKKFNLDYKIKPSEIGKLKKVEATEEQIIFYLESTKWNLEAKTVDEFCGKLNVIRRLMTEEKQSISSFSYSAEHEASLEGKALQEYWRKLRNAGYRLDKSGGKRNWVKGTPENKAPPEEPQASGEQEKKVQQQMNVLANKFRTV
ncbi:hypothetical protein [Flammeovirga sp. OC4]|uniref:hypothetical protein n=1 Tax=Flammeovirga sp. OC4 TaxID=1382345 RepID=UPI0005C46D47|nr:hypothetical protein [Flammeovirga sp. OC4]